MSLDEEYTKEITRRDLANLKDWAMEKLLPLNISNDDIAKKIIIIIFEAYNMGNKDGLSLVLEKVSRIIGEK